MEKKKGDNQVQSPVCSGHRKDLFGETDIKKVAEAIGDLHYETLAELFNHLQVKIANDAVKDYDADRKKLSSCLMIASNHLELAFMGIYEAWQISKPFMNQNSKP